MLEGLALAFGVAMDASAVAAARALVRDARASEGLIMALLFGAFQAGMAALGFALAHVGADWFEAIDHWIAAVTLFGIGGKMLREGWKARGQPEHAPAGRLSVRTYLVLAVATSIDAAAIGMSLPLLDVGPWLAIALIGVVTAACTAVAYALARAIGKRLGAGMEAVGGLVLIAIGVKVLVEHLA